MEIWKLTWALKRDTLNEQRMIIFKNLPSFFKHVKPQDRKTVLLSKAVFKAFGILEKKQEVWVCTSAVFYTYLY